MRTEEITSKLVHSFIFHTVRSLCSMMSGIVDFSQMFSPNVSALFVTLFSLAKNCPQLWTGILRPLHGLIYNHSLGVSAAFSIIFFTFLSFMILSLACVTFFHSKASFCLNYRHLSMDTKFVFKHGLDFVDEFTAYSKQKYILKCDFQVFDHMILTNVSTCVWCCSCLYAHCTCQSPLPSAFYRSKNKHVCQNKIL